MFTPIDVDAKQVHETIRAVVAERPDYVYSNPYEAQGEDKYNGRYVHPDGPGCLIGVVLNRLGVPLDELERWEGNGGARVADHCLNFPQDSHGDVRALKSLIGFAQIRQDNGATWQEALNTAEEYSGRAVV